MDDKLQLPDELLDRVAGGRIVIDGETVTRLTHESDNRCKE